MSCLSDENLPALVDESAETERLATWLHAIPVLRFENPSLTAFAGRVLVQQFFALIDLKARLREWFRHLSGTVFGRATIFHQWIVTRQPCAIGGPGEWGQFTGFEVAA